MAIPDGVPGAVWTSSSLAFCACLSHVCVSLVRFPLNWESRYLARGIDDGWGWKTLHR